MGQSLTEADILRLFDRIYAGLSRRVHAHGEGLILFPVVCSLKAWLSVSGYPPPSSTASAAVNLQ